MDPNESDRLRGQFLDWLVIAGIFAVALVGILSIALTAIEIAKSLMN